MTNVRAGKSETGKLHQYMEIGNELRRRITLGQYLVGSILPTEGMLCEEFTTSRHTIREALRMLTDAGFIERRQGSGSHVLTAVPSQRYVHDMSSLDQLFQYAVDTRFIINDVKFAVPENSMLSDVSGGKAEWLIVHGLRLERDDDIPICFSIVLVNRDYASIAEELETGSGAIYRKIEDKFDIKVSQVIQDITITTMPQRAALVLDKTTLDVAVQVRRRYLLADGTVFLVSVNQHPADEFSYTMQLRREGEN